MFAFVIMSWLSSMPVASARLALLPFLTPLCNSGHCATSQKVGGSISDGVFEIFHGPNPSGSVMALDSTQPVIEMGTRDVDRGKGSRCIGLTILPPSCTY